MATKTNAASPKKSSGFTGIKSAIWVMAICLCLGYGFWYFVLGNPDNFAGGTHEGRPLNLMGTVYHGGYVVGLIFTLMFTVVALSIERYFALRTAFGKSSLTKFVQQVKAAVKANDFDKARELCNKQQGSVANVVLASVNAYCEMETTSGIKKAQKVAKIQQAHEEATQLEMPTLQMNLPIIATIVTLGTLTALFGTVLGMIGSFQALAAGGGGDSMALSLGISEALVNTASGIATSWVAVVAYHTYTNKIDKLTYALDEVGYTIAQTYEANHTEEA